MYELYDDDTILKYRDDLLVDCCRSTAVTAKVCFPDTFNLPFSDKIHAPIFKLLDSNERFVVIASTREIGKTKIIQLAFAARMLLFRLTHFLVSVSCTATQAESQSEALKRELLNNRIISQLGFPSVKPQKADGIEFSKECWVTNWDGQPGTMVMPRGSGQQIRGQIYGRYRPHIIILDDIQSIESVQSEEQRGKLKEWFYADVLGAIDRHDDTSRIIVIGNILHEDCLISNLIADPTWVSETIPLCDEDGHSYWPEQTSDEKVAAIKQRFQNAGKLDTFYREYMCLCVATETATFRQEMFKHYSESDKNYNTDPKIESVVLLDPARTTKMASDETAMVCVGVNTSNDMLSVRDIEHGHFTPDKSIDLALDMCVRNNARVLGVEVTGLNDFITYPIRNEILRRRLNIELVEIKAIKDKEARVRSLSNFYRRGMVEHNSACCGALEAQLLSFPKSRRWDIMDAFANIVELLEEGDRYFYGISSEENYDKQVNDEYKELEEEDAKLGDTSDAFDDSWAII